MIVGALLSWGEKAWTPVHALKWNLPFVGQIDTGLGFAAYNGLTAVAANLVVAGLLSVVLRSKAPDETSPEDYDDRDYGQASSLSRSRVASPGTI